MTEATRARLLAAAEVLFAQQGIDHVRLTEVNERAGVRNDSAVSYYFGSREGLVAAILDHHHQEIAEVLQVLDADRPAEGRTARDAIDLLAQTLADRLATTSGRAYLQVLGEVFTRGVAFPTLDDDVERPTRLAGVQEAVVVQLADIEQHLQHLPADLRVERLHRLSDFVVASFAARARSEDRGDVLHLTSEAFVRDLVDMATAAALAPSTA
ncbi:hypothetical protein B7486_53705 [cyanobacterium TDX16]|nr:hypothetical protein B7486_53705 [cyanobacterium TDX16]